jgi:hypothetical protein
MEQHSCLAETVGSSRRSSTISHSACSNEPSTICLRFAAFLPAFAVVRPRKTRFRLVANLYRTGVTTPQGPE